MPFISSKSKVLQVSNATNLEKYQKKEVNLISTPIPQCINIYLFLLIFILDNTLTISHHHQLTSSLLTTKRTHLCSTGIDPKCLMSNKEVIYHKNVQQTNPLIQQRVATTTTTTHLMPGLPTVKPVKPTPRSEMTHTTWFITGKPQLELNNTLNHYLKKTVTLPIMQENYQTKQSNINSIATSNHTRHITHPYKNQNLITEKPTCLIKKNNQLK